MSLLMLTWALIRELILAFNLGKRNVSKQIERDGIIPPKK